MTTQSPNSLTVDEGIKTQVESAAEALAPSNAPQLVSSLTVDELSELRQKVEQQIAQLPPEHLFLVSSFIDSIETKEDVNNKRFRRIPPLKRNKKASDLLRHQ